MARSGVAQAGGTIVGTGTAHGGEAGDGEGRAARGPGSPDVGRRGTAFDQGGHVRGEVADPPGNASTAAPGVDGRADAVAAARVRFDSAATRLARLDRFGRPRDPWSEDPREASSAARPDLASTTELLLACRAELARARAECIALRRVAGALQRRLAQARAILTDPE